MKRFWLTLLAAGILVLGGCSRRGEDSPSSQVSGAAPSGEGVIRTLYIGRGEDFQQVPTFEGTYPRCTHRRHRRRRGGIWPWRSR